MDPLVLVAQAELQGTLPKALARKVRTRAQTLEAAILRSEKASGLLYPPYYIEPVLPVSRSGVEFGQMGVLFARVIPATVQGSLSIVVQFTAALVAFGSKGTMEAVAAHEFTHYLDLVRRLSRTNLVSDERSSTLFESAYADSERTIQPKLVFSDKVLVSLINRKFGAGLSDERLNEQVSEKWLGKNLPVRLVAPDENVVRVGVGSVLNTSFDPRVLQKIASIEGKATP
ncbi:MAG TPA: hypothetical protein VLY21_06415 [Nitrososphaerales archaeon]|nr:hypothetical protein [Nitrososphaerales archaeon]